MDGMASVVDNDGPHTSSDSMNGAAAGACEDRASGQSNKHTASGASGQPKFSNGPYVPFSLSSL